MLRLERRWQLIIRLQLNVLARTVFECFSSTVRLKTHAVKTIGVPHQYSRTSFGAGAARQKQLMSTFTASLIPPILLQDNESLVMSHRNGARQRKQFTGWGPNDESVVFIPICIASAPQVPARPVRILQPPSVPPDTAGSEWPAQQVWAGPLSGGAFVVVL
eukprot:gene25501-10631_t